MTAVAQFANFTWTELGEPISPTTTIISGWAVSNLGKLNILINTAFTTDGNEFYPACGFGAQESGIYQELYNSKYYEKEIRKSLDGANWTANVASGSILWVRLQEGDSVIQRVDPTSILKTYQALKSETDERLDDLVYQYKFNKIKPSQVTGDDII